MAYRHGIYISEVPTKVVPPVISDAGLPVVFGTAPVHLAKEPAGVNEPKLIYSYEEAVRQFGYSEDWESYTLCEFMYSHFVLYQRAPVVLINVLDDTVHIKNATEELNLENGKGVLAGEGIKADTVIVKAGTGDVTYNLAEDYMLIYDENGLLTVRVVETKIPDGLVKVEYTQLAPEMITSKEIIGGIDINTNKKKGLELVSDIFPRFRIVPGSILAPKFSVNPEVAAIMVTKASKVSGVFSAQALIDAPTDINYTETPEWKNLKNIIDKRQFVGYLKLGLGDKGFHYSTQLAGVLATTDEEHGGIPYVTPSNKNLKMDRAFNDKGDVFLTQDEANYLNGQGIMTALNFIDGWVAWGNRTAAYPGNSDPKDSFIPVRRMFDWVGNTLVLTFWNKIDEPTNKRLIETIVDSANLWLNGLTAQGVLLGGRIEFRKDENPASDVMDGILKFHVHLTPPSPGRELDFIQEYDVNYVEAFINEMAGE